MNRPDELDVFRTELGRSERIIAKIAKSDWGVKAESELNLIIERLQRFINIFRKQSEPPRERRKRTAKERKELDEIEKKIMQGLL